MAADMRVFRVRTSLEEERPEITGEVEANRAVDWLRVGEIVDGERPLAEYAEIEVAVDAPDAAEWDYYAVGGTLGMVSPRAKRLLESLGRGSFTFLPARLNGAPYYLLACMRRLDCLDYERSTLAWFEDDPPTIKDIKRPRFKAGCFTDPQLFCIPEDSSSMYATQSVPALFKSAGLRGFRFDDAEKLGR